MNTLDKQYTDLLQDILNNGVEKKDRTGTGTKSIFGRQIRHNMKDGFPLLTTKKMPFKTIVTELLWFLRGDTNIKYLVDNNCHIWVGDSFSNYCKQWAKYPSEGIFNPNEYSSPTEHEAVRFTQEEFINKIKTDNDFAREWGELGPIYGKQWREWKTYKHKMNYEPYLPVNTDGKVECYVENIDQIAILINDLKTNPDSRRLMVNAWNVGELDQMVLPPCHFSFQCYSHEKEGKRYLSLAWNQRSVDCGLGLPFNIASYGLLLEILAKEVGMIPDQLIGNLGDCHLYNDHIKPIKEQLIREPFPLPTFDCPAMDEIPHNTFDELVNRLLPCDFYMDDYQSHPTIKLPLSN
jgi:thymidylate synthase